jgi:hypothetical protein
MKRTALVAVALVAGCSSSGNDATSTPTPAPTTAAPSPTATAAPTATASPYGVVVVPSDFSANVTNPWFPLPPGRTLEYRGVNEDGKVRELFTISDETQKVDGVACRVVLDRLFVDGVLAETTRDFYAQDRKGDVWYFGEDTAELDEDGSMVTTEGTFHAGEAGALPGVFMTAHPAVGDSHRQEYYPGHAEDFYAVELLATRVVTPYRTFTSALRTREWTPLEPGVLDRKYYVKGIGTVKEVTVKGGKEELELYAIRND